MTITDPQANHLTFSLHGELRQDGYPHPGFYESDQKFKLVHLNGDGGRHTSLIEHVQYEVAQAIPSLEGEKRLLGEILKADLPASSEEMIGGEKGDKGLAQEKTGLELRRELAAEPDHRDVELSFTQQVLEAQGGVFLAEHEVHARTRATKLGNGAGEQSDTQSGQHAYPDLAAALRGNLVNSGLSQLEFGEDAFCVDAEGGPSGSEHEPARQASEQGQTELAFELADLLAEGRLSDKEARRGAREVALLTDRNEVADLLQLQGSTPSGATGNRRTIATLPDDVELRQRVAEGRAVHVR